jgi:hypothetical protein
MSRIRQILVATGTFSIALGIGFVMQNGDALAARFGESPVPATTALTAEPVSLGVTRPQARPAIGLADPVVDVAANGAQIADVANDAALTTAVSVATVVPPAIEDPVIGIVAPQADLIPIEVADEGTTFTPDRAPIVLASVTEPDAAPAPLQSQVIPEPSCLVSLIATAAPAAMVDLELSAPCSPLAQLTVHHQGMMFTVTTDDAGMAVMHVPTLAENGVFIADLGNGEGAVAVVTVPDFDQFDRVVLQWQGTEGPEIHALEFGATYGESGHVWQGSARSADTALAGEGGFLVRLGDGLGQSPMMAEVYTFPSHNSMNAGAVAFSVETPVTPGNCGTELQAQTIQVSPGAEPFALDLTMAIPACESVGEILVLKNMLLDLTLAAR